MAYDKASNNDNHDSKRSDAFKFFFENEKIIGAMPELDKSALALTERRISEYLKAGRKKQLPAIQAAHTNIIANEERRVQNLADNLNYVPNTGDLAEAGYQVKKKFAIYSVLTLIVAYSLLKNTKAILEIDDLSLKTKIAACLFGLLVLGGTIAYLTRNAHGLYSNYSHSLRRIGLLSQTPSTLLTRPAQEQTQNSESNVPLLQNAGKF